MPATFRFSDFHLNYLADVAREEPTLCGELHIKDTDHTTQKWQKRWIVLYQNCLFYFENSSSGKPVGMIFLEHSSIDVLSLTKLRDLSNQVNNACIYRDLPWKLFFNSPEFFFHFLKKCVNATRLFIGTLSGNPCEEVDGNLSNLSSTKVLVFMYNMYSLSFCFHIGVLYLRIIFLLISCIGAKRLKALIYRNNLRN